MDPLCFTASGGLTRETILRLVCRHHHPFLLCQFRTETVVSASCTKAPAGGCNVSITTSGLGVRNVVSTSSAHSTPFSSSMTCSPTQWQGVHAATTFLCCNGCSCLLGALSASAVLVGFRPCFERHRGYLNDMCFIFLRVIRFLRFCLWRTDEDRIFTPTPKTIPLHSQLERISFLELYLCTTLENHLGELFPVTVFLVKINEN